MAAVSEQERVAWAAYLARTQGLDGDQYDLIEPEEWHILQAKLGSGAETKEKQAA